jgi:hypothetical protein
MNALGTWESTNPLCPGESYVGGLRNMPTEELWDAYPDLRNKSIVSLRPCSWSTVSTLPPYLPFPVLALKSCRVLPFCRSRGRQLTAQLFAGDSVGRHMFEWFCWMAKSPIDGKAPEGFETYPYGGTSQCQLPALGLKMAQIHTYSQSNLFAIPERPGV